MVSRAMELKELQTTAELLSARIEHLTTMMRMDELASNERISKQGRQVSKNLKENKAAEENGKFVRYKEGAKKYNMCQSKFEQLAKEANACYKINKIVLVNTEILDKYLETFRVITES